MSTRREYSEVISPLSASSLNLVSISVLNLRHEKYFPIPVPTDFHEYPQKLNFKKISILYDTSILFFLFL